MPFDEYEGDQPPNWGQIENWWDEGTEKIKPEVVLRQVAPNSFQLVRGFRYKLPAGDKGARVSRIKLALWYLRGRREGKPRPTEGGRGPWNVPPSDLFSNPKCAENSTDLASVPSWLWWFVASHGRHSRAALLHDHLIGPTEDDVTDKQADHAFRMALADSEVPILRRWLMWDAVSLASMSRTLLGKGAVLLFGLHVAAFAGALAYATYASWDGLGGALARPFVEIWRVAEFLRVPDFLSWLGSSLWSSFDWALPSAVEGHWWKVAVLGLAGMVIWRKRWLISLPGLALIALPTLAVFTSYALAFVAELSLWCLSGLASLVPKVEAPAAAKPVFGKPYREQIGRM